MSTITVKPTKPVKTKVEELVTKHGVWRIYDDDSKKAYGSYREFNSHLKIFGRPLYSYAKGINPDTGWLSCANGILAVGQRAKGFIAIGQLASGTIAMGQVATGRAVAVGQVAIAPLAAGQLALGVAVVGQLGFGGWGVFQTGAYVFSGIGMRTFDVMKLFASWF